LDLFSAISNKVRNFLTLVLKNVFLFHSEAPYKLSLLYCRWILKYTTILDGTLYLWGASSPFKKDYSVFNLKYAKKMKLFAPE